MNPTTIILIAVISFFVLLFVVLRILRKMMGSIQILPEKYNYGSGEEIKGKVILNIKKPVSAEKLIIGLKCEKNETIYSMKDKKSHERTNVIFNFNQPLEGEKEYTSGEYSYDFSIKSPTNSSKEINGIAGNLIKSAQIVFGKNSFSRWYLYSELKCKGVNLFRQIQINLS